MANYQSLQDTLKGRSSRKIGNNTYLENRNGDLCIVLHSTCILRYKPDGSIVLNAGGWHTYTTKARMNEYLPYGVRIAQEKHQWYVYDNGNKYPFEEGYTTKAS